MAPRDLSNLPDELLLRILSRLPSELVASTSILSPKWRNLFRSTSSLKFRFGEDGNEDRFVGFVNGMLAARKNILLKKFSLRLVRDIDEVQATAWIVYALAQRVEDLRVGIYELRNEDYQLPQDIIVSRCLVRLKISTNQFHIIPLEGLVVNLPNLKSLHLDGVYFGHGMVATIGFSNLISGCPRLEELLMKDVEWFEWESCSVTSQTLKTFRFFYVINAGEGERNGCPQKVSFYTPNLLFLEYFDDVAHHYPTLSFHSLIGAKIRLVQQGINEEEEVEEEEVVAAAVPDASEFFMGINKVKNLYLSADTVQVLTYHCLQTPEFVNLKHLDVECHADIGWGSLPNILNNSPNLQTLALYGLFHEATNDCGDLCPCDHMEANPSYLSASPVKMVKIFERHGEAGEETKFVNHIKHLLEKMPKLTDLMVYLSASTPPIQKQLRIQRQLQETHIASPICRIQVF